MMVFILIRNLRWWIGILLFASTVINYIDRQTLSVLAPALKDQYHWTNTDFATVLIAFRISYTIMQSISGRALDRLGTRTGLSLSVAFYSVVAACTSLAHGLGSFRIFRALLGAGESAGWPGAAKAVSEWFPDRERAWAVALFDSGSSIGGAVAPFLVLFLYHTFGGWQPAFLITASLGFLWLIVWRKVYHTPETHPRITPEELKLIQSSRQSEIGVARSPARPIAPSQLFRFRQTWGIVVGRSLLDPYWFMIAEWFAIYLASKGFRMEESALGFWAPFMAADLGNFFGGGLSSYWIRRGWSVGKSRRTVVTIFGPSMLLLIPAAFSSRYWLLVGLFAFATFAYAACSTIFISLPADVFQSSAVATVSGMSGTGAGIVTLVSTYLIGRVSDRMSFQPIIIVASMVPCLAALIMVTLVRPPKQPDSSGILRSF
ncbi:MAG: MFS transporter [Bryobacteraceae bacterium]|jgi:MFS transporter, ACS family, hexuronate transporter